MNNKLLSIILLVIIAALLSYIFFALPAQRNKDFLVQQQECYQAASKKDQMTKEENKDDLNMVILDSEYRYDAKSQRCLYKNGTIYSTNKNYLESYYIDSLYTNQHLAFYLMSNGKIIGNGDKNLYDKIDSEYFQ